MKEFYFFRGFVISRRTALWFPENDALDYYRNDYINGLSQEIARTIDEDMINYMTRMVNGGGQLSLSERIEQRLTVEGGNRA